MTWLLLWERGICWDAVDREVTSKAPGLILETENSLASSPFSGPNATPRGPGRQSQVTPRTGSWASCCKGKDVKPGDSTGGQPHDGFHTSLPLTCTPQSARLRLPHLPPLTCPSAPSCVPVAPAAQGHCSPPGNSNSQSTASSASLCAGSGG